ncbi:MAG: Threonine dehydrogenase and related Zn-dependent dehydrogenases, partial [uncultured Solirubrobacteraceae bacterium]
EGPRLARQARRPRRHRLRPDHRAPDGRDHQGHLVGLVRLGPPPLRGARPLPRRGRHPRPRTHGHRRGGRRRRRAHRSRRPRRHPLQRLLRPLLHVRQRAHVPVRDHPGTRVRLGGGLPGLHQALRADPGRSGGVPPGAAGAVRADQGARGPQRRPLPVPVRRAADRLAGRPVHRHAGRRHHLRHRLGPDRPDERPHRPASRQPGDRHRPRGRSGRPRAPGRDRGVRSLRDRGHRGRGPRSHRRPGTRRGDRRRRHGGPRLAGSHARPDGGWAAARRGGAQGVHDRGHRPDGGPQHGDGARQARRHDLDLRRVRRRREPDEPAGPVRQAGEDPHGPGERQALGGRPHAAAQRQRRSARRGGLRLPPRPAQRGSRGLQELPGQGGRHLQGRLQAV